MNIFNFKRKTPAKRKVAIKKPVTQKAPPKPWTPPFQSGTNLKKPVQKFTEPERLLKPKDNVPEVIEGAPTYILPEHREEFVSIPKPERPKSQKEQQTRQEFMKVFRELTYRWRSWDIWADFITMTACMISNVIDKLHFDEREAQYMRTIKKYNKEEQELFAELFINLVEALEDNQEQDFLGDIYCELGLNSKERKQIFTPYHVAHLMAEVAVGDVQKDIQEKGFVTVYDCCCGSGVTLIAAINVIKNRLVESKLNYQNHVLVIGQDIDYVATMMCYIQLSLLGAAGYFKVGNTITDPMRGNDSLNNYWFTPMYCSDVWAYRRIFHSLDKLFQAPTISEEMRNE